MTTVNENTPSASNNGTDNNARESDDRVGASKSGSYYLEDLKPGMSATFTKTVTEADVVAFANVSGDHNPIHLDEVYAARTVFKTRIAHGMLSAGYISATLASRMPGAGAVYVGQTLKFRAPVKIGDTVVTRVEVTSTIPEKKFVILKTQCLVDGKTVIDGEATLLVPSRAGL